MIKTIFETSLRYGRAAPFQAQQGARSRPLFRPGARSRGRVGWSSRRAGGGRRRRL